MLAMKANCERCDCSLPADLDGAFICSFECTYCRECAEDVLDFRCPNCAGLLAERPTRVGPALRKHPPQGSEPE